MGFKVIPKIKNDAEELAKKKSRETDYFSAAEVSESTKLKSDELIEMLEKQVKKKKKKEKLLKRDATGTLVPGNVVSAKALMRGVIVGISIVILALLVVWIFSGQKNLDIGKHFYSNVNARVWEEYNGNSYQSYDSRVLNIKDLQGGAQAKQVYRSIEFKLKPNGKVFVYSINFKVKTEGIGQFALVAVIDDGGSTFEYPYFKIVSSANKEFNVEIVLNYTFNDTDNGDCFITIYTQSINDDFNSDQSMDDDIRGWTMYNLKFKK